MSVSSRVSSRVERMKRGVPFSITGFYTLGNHTSVQKALSRLTQKSVVERVSKGIYVRPNTLPSMPCIKTTASAKQVAKVWAKEHGYKLVSQGQEAAYRLGLQTQAPMRTVLWSNGPTRKFKVGNEIVEIRHVSEQKLRWQKEPEGMLLRGLLVTPPESIKISGLQNAIKRLSLSVSATNEVVRKLNSVSLLQPWRNKLHQLKDAG